MLRRAIMWGKFTKQYNIVTIIDFHQVITPVQTDGTSGRMVTLYIDNSNTGITFVFTARERQKKIKNCLTFCIYNFRV